MPQLTKRMIAEEIRRVAMGGFLSDRDRVREGEIYLAINEVTNKILKVQAMDTMYNIEGGSNLSGLVLATFSNITVTRGVNYGRVKTAVAELPITPYLLPNGMGVYSLYPEGMPFEEFYPIPIGMISAWLKDSRVSGLIDNTYSLQGNKLIIFSDLFASGNPEVGMTLAILDINGLGENDILPIPPEYLDDIVNAVIARYQEPDTKRKETDQPSPSMRPDN